MPHLPLPSFPFLRPELSPAWKALDQLRQRTRLSLRDLTSSPPSDWPSRNQDLQFHAAGLSLNAQYQLLDQAQWRALLALAQAQGLSAWVQAQRSGIAVNTTESRPALHCLLRADPQNLPPDLGQNLDHPTEVFKQVFEERHRMLLAADQLHAGRATGYQGLPITDLVNLGIGGSDLGPRMATQALEAGQARQTGYQQPSAVRVHYLSNPDPWAVEKVIRTLNPAQTQFVVQSKSFTTPETLRTFETARTWLQASGCPTSACMRHFLAVTARPDLALAMGFTPEQIFRIWPWVGGRTSVWSSIGLPLAVAIGSKAFKAFLAGARDMDTHFWSAPAKRNMPLALALFGIWNRNFLHASSQVISVYSNPLSGLVPYLQQLDMESNGKSVHISGEACQIGTGPIVWGGLGLDGQHAYFQLLHQGQHQVAIDFIAVENDLAAEQPAIPYAKAHQAMVHANLRAQAKALAWGRTAAETIQHIQSEDPDADPVALAAMVAHRQFRGNVPSNQIWLHQRDAYHLGALLALYEHKVFCQAVIWQIQPFDQWGVELGKTMLSPVSP